MKAFADDKLNVTKMINSVFKTPFEKKLLEKEKMLVQAFSPFPTMISKGVFPRPVERCQCVGMGKSGPEVSVVCGREEE